MERLVEASTPLHFFLPLMLKKTFVGSSAAKKREERQIAQTQEMKRFTRDFVAFLHSLFLEQTKENKWISFNSQRNI